MDGHNKQNLHERMTLKASGQGYYRGFRAAGFDVLNYSDTILEALCKRLKHCLYLRHVKFIYGQGNRGRIKRAESLCDVRNKYVSVHYKFHMAKIR